MLCLMLLGVIAGSILGTVVAYTPPGGWPAGQPYFTLYAMVSSDLPYGTWVGGYHDVIYEIQKELAKIGINLEIRMYNSWTVYSTCWWDYYDVPSTEELPPNGWDITMGDWWISEASTIWVETMCADEYMPPYGYNLMSWNNSDADELLRAGIYTLDAETRKDNLWDWQELFMHDPPLINLYYPYLPAVQGIYLKGHAPFVWLSTVDHLALNASEMDAARKALGETTFRLGVSGDMPNVMSLYMSGYTSSAYWYACFDSLFMDYYDYNETTGLFDTTVMKRRGELAADLTTWLDDTTAIIPIRDDVYWVKADGTKSEKFDAGDVKFSIDVVLDPATGSPSMGDWAGAIESAEVLSNATLQNLGLFDVTKCMYEPYVVQVNLKAPFGDFNEVITMNWGGGMLPEHLLGGYAHGDLKTSPYYYDPYIWEFTGPYIIDEWAKGQYVKLKTNPHYYDPDQITGTVDYITMRIIPDDATRMLELETHGVDAVEYVWAPVEVIDEWKERPDLRVFEYRAPESNCVYFNLNNPYLSNRYVRLAIAHAIPYERIKSEILPGWGIARVTDGRSIIVPYCSYTEPNTTAIETPDLNGTTVSLYNTELLPYEYDLGKAEKYMDMWRFSQVGTDYTLGPVGDGDFSGWVEVDDFTIWANAIVKGTLTSADWIFEPGNDIDPDYDNTNYVELADYYRWGNSSGIYYPEGTLYWQWSR